MLVEWFLEQPLYYNQRCPDFRHRMKREKLLEKVSYMLRVSGPYVNTWFHNMRIMYGKLLRWRKS